MEFFIKNFQDLTVHELYEILQLRSEIFLLEQNCVYQDLDFKDQKALHIFGKKNNKILAYTRIFKAGDYFKESSIGRVVVNQNQRKFGYGHDLMKYSIDCIQQQFNTSKITISAQVYLTKFYQSHGFNQVGEMYLEDGIPHIEMLRL